MDTVREDASRSGTCEELTRKVSSADAVASHVIPAGNVLQRLLTKETEEDSGIKTMKGILTAEAKTRFYDVEKNPLYWIATGQNPR